MVFGEQAKIRRSAISPCYQAKPNTQGLRWRRCTRNRIPRNRGIQRGSEDPSLSNLVSGQRLSSRLAKSESSTLRTSGDRQVSFRDLTSESTTMGTASFTGRNQTAISTVSNFTPSARCRPAQQEPLHLLYRGRHRHRRCPWQCDTAQVDRRCRHPDVRTRSTHRSGPGRLD